MPRKANRPKIRDAIEQTAEPEVDQPQQGGYVVLTAIVRCKTDADMMSVDVVEPPGAWAIYDKQMLRNGDFDDLNYALKAALESACEVTNKAIDEQIFSESSAQH